MTGIIGAMDIEVAAVKERMDVEEVKTVAGMEFFCGRLAGRRIVVVKCGVGKVHAAMCAQAMFANFDVVRAINIGVAGAINNDLDILDVVIGTDFVQHDVDATAAGTYALGHVPGVDVFAFAADKTLADLAAKACHGLMGQHKIAAGRVATGDQFVHGQAHKERILQNFGAYCVEMEGAAIAQVCRLNNIPFVGIRAISDKADGSATMDFSAFAEQAAARSIEIVIRMLSQL